MAEDDSPTIGKTSKDILRKFVPDSLLQERNIVLRLGPAGRIYARLRILDALGISLPNQRRPPASARSFLFVCFGNIMRSAMAEAFARRALKEAKLDEQARIFSAGLHAAPGREAHLWAQQASSELGISLADHRAKLLARQVIEQSDAIFAMDFQNKAELLTLYPDAQHKIYMLSAYAEGPTRFREIRDPYLGSLEGTRLCAQQLQTCIRNLLRAQFPSADSARRESK